MKRATENSRKNNVLQETQMQFLKSDSYSCCLVCYFTGFIFERKKNNEKYTKPHRSIKCNVMYMQYDVWRRKIHGF